MNEPITCVDVLRPERTITQDFQSDLVVVGTERSLLVFDVFNNKTIFHRDMPEGVECVRISRVEQAGPTVIVCGCGSTIWGIGAQGEDVFWTTLGDDVHSLDLCDVDEDGVKEVSECSDQD